MSTVLVIIYFSLVNHVMKKQYHYTTTPPKSRWRWFYIKYSRIIARGRLPDEQSPGIDKLKDKS